MAASSDQLAGRVSAPAGHPPTNSHSPKGIRWNHQPEQTFTGANLLVVDDEYAARRTLVNLLRHSGYKVTEASNGHSALELITRHRFDLVIVDLKMPDMDGTEVLAQARPLARDTVFIILTAFGTMDSAVAALRHGAFDYLLKPSSLQDIIRSVEAGLAERRRRLNPEDPVALLERALAGLKSAPHESACHHRRAPCLHRIAFSNRRMSW